jgi:hypothetical protein
MGNSFLVSNERRINVEEIINVKALYNGVEITLINGDIYYVPNYSVEQIVDIVNQEKSILNKKD